MLILLQQVQMCALSGANTQIFERRHREMCTYEWGGKHARMIESLRGYQHERFLCDKQPERKTKWEMLTISVARLSGLPAN